jgi:hypothetical protein
MHCCRISHVIEHWRIEDIKRRTPTHTHLQTDTLVDKHSDTHSLTDTHTNPHGETNTARHTQTYSLSHKETYRHTYRYTYRETLTHRGRNKDFQSNRLFEISEFNWTELLIFLHFQGKNPGNRIGFRRQPTPISTPDTHNQIVTHPHTDIYTERHRLYKGRRHRPKNKHTNISRGTLTETVGHGQL